MKIATRVICILVILLINIVPVSARDATNKLYFSNSGNRIYYDSKLFDKNTFMHHTDMIPGSSYEDRLLIENNTNTEYDLYLKVKEIKQNEYANELLDNILMEIYLDDKLIYDGTIKGLDYNNSGVNLQESVYIGKYSKGIENELIVKTHLKEEYGTITEENLSHIEWEFYAVYDNEVNVIPPNTGVDIITAEVLLNIILISTLLVISVACFQSIKKLYN